MSKELGDVIIEAQDLRKIYPGGIVALDDFSLAVRQREVVVIIGPSGSGKSTFLRCLNGLEPVDEGSIVVDDIPLDGSKRNLKQIRTEVGMVFQSFNLFPHMTVRQNVNLAQRLVRGKSREDADLTTDDLLAKVGISEKAEAYPEQLSGGQQQRVAIARALAMHPLVMMFDEATSALDPEMIGEVLEVMENLAHEGMTMLVVTHEMGFAREAGDRIVFIDEGRLVEQGPTEKMFTSPERDRTQKFLSKIL